MNTQSEALLEENLLKQLQSLGYERVVINIIPQENWTIFCKVLFS